MSRAEVVCKTSNHPGDSDPYSPDLVPCDFWFFPKLKSPFKGKKISACHWDSGKYDGAADGDWENCWGPKVPTLKGTEVSLSCVQCFLYLIFSIINVSVFHSTWLDTFWTDLCISLPLLKVLSLFSLMPLKIQICYLWNILYEMF